MDREGSAIEAGPPLSERMETELVAFIQQQVQSVF